MNDREKEAFTQDFTPQGTKNENKNWDNYVDRAIEQDDLSDLNQKLQDSIDSAIDFVRDGAKQVYKSINRKGEKRPLPVNRNPRYVAQLSGRNPYAWKANLSMLFTGIFGIGLVDEIVFGFQYHFEIGDALILLILTAVSLFMSIHFTKKKRLMKNFKRYRVEIGNNRVVPLLDFATAVSLPVEDVAEELRFLIAEGYFPEGRVVEREELFLVDNTAYAAYKDHYLEQKQAKAMEQERTSALPDDDRTEKIQQYYNITHELRDKIRDQDFRDTVDELLRTLRAIELALTTDPKRIEELNKFVDYYSPTTIKLITRFLEFENAQVEVENTERSKREIKKSVSTVVAAYKNLLNELYEDETMNLASEMEVMETILRQDGLLQDKGKE